VSGFGISRVPIGSGLAGLCALPVSAGDRAQVVEFAPDLVVSLTQAHEMRDAGAADLGPYLMARGLDWLHLPVPDYGVPGQVADWPAALVRMRAVLDGGGRVLVHCRAGLGRTGSVILALMVATGEGGEAALARLRAARPGAVETDAQLRWATGQDRSGRAGAAARDRS
jgi:protein-tyrosine phosphatase